MSRYKKTVVISLGGSIVVPEVGHIDWQFLRRFKKIIDAQIAAGTRCIMVVGGGKTCRLYQQAASKVSQLVDEDLDWLGIHATRLNAHLLRTIFRDVAYPKINTRPLSRPAFDQPVLVAAGWKPGFSTDYDAVQLAIGYGATEVINLSNITYVYDADPAENPQAKKMRRVSWPDFRAMVGDTWSPGGNFPFDPIASALAEKHNLTVHVMDGRNTANLSRYLRTGQYQGTTIHPV